MEMLKAAILGIIQGITEWLPISSTGHLLLADEFIRLSGSESFKSVFWVIVQLGSVLAVLCLYWTELSPFKRDRKERNGILNLWGKVLVATVPAAIAGLLLDVIIYE